MFNFKTSIVKHTFIRLISVGLLIIIWAFSATLTADVQTLPGPALVFNFLIQEIYSGELSLHLGATLFRVVCAFIIAMTFGTALGLLMGIHKKSDRWLDSWLIVLLNLPALVTIVLCYLWIGLTEVAAITAIAINKIPMISVMIREGAKAFDKQLDAMGKVFVVSKSTHFKHILLPQLTPQIAAASRSGLALIWKIVLVVEFLGRPNGIGFQIHLGFQLFDITMVMAYALAFIIVMLIIELVLIQPFERYVNRWRAV